MDRGPRAGEGPKTRPLRDAEGRRDVVVVGAGLAGTIAAWRAAELGASVLLLERSRRWPAWNNSVLSGGVVHALLRDPATPPEELLGVLMEVTDGEARPDVARAWANNATRAVRWLADHGARFSRDPDQPFRSVVFEPVKETLPGTPFKGFGLPAWLEHAATEMARAGAQRWQPARARALERSPGGWRVQVATAGGQRSVDARAVVLADGGFQADAALLRRHLGTDRIKRRAAGTSTGDALRMGLAAGGVAWQTRSFYGHLLAREALERSDLWPYPILDGLAAHGVVLGADGRRLVEPDAGGVTTTNAVAWSSDPLGCWLVVDEAAWQSAGRRGTPPPNPHLEEHGASVQRAASAAALARAAGLPEAAVALEVASLGEPPYRAIRLVAGVTFMLGGLLVDGRARVLTAEDRPIPGLLAAGGTMGGLHGGPRAGYAGGLLEAAVFGLIAGESAARPPEA
jgi:succinate dehydrogenase/fumarate reductase flavoprotein subunit